MSLRDLVAALGGDLYAGGARASVPAPGHSPSDRSVSLLLSGDRVVIHSFGGAAWTEVRDHLVAAGLIDRSGRITGSPTAGRAAQVRAAPDATVRLAAARRLWAEAGPLTPATLSGRHLAGRAIRRDPAAIAALRHHPAAPRSVYRAGGPGQAALVAAVSAPDGGLTAVEVTYLAPGGRRDARLRLSRKTVGLVPAGSAVRLDPPGAVLLVAEGVMTALSAGERFGLPAWALGSAGNLAVWRAPDGVGRVLIAADPGAAGEAAAARLARRLGAQGVKAEVALPPAGAGDWNALAVSERRREGG